MEATRTAGRRAEALNLLSFLVVVSMSLAVSIYAVLRFVHADPARWPGALRAPAPTALATRPAPPLPAPPAAAIRVRLPGATPDVDGVVSHGARSQRLVALTFDSDLTPAMSRRQDGGGTTRYVNDRVLGELRQAGVPATFFLTGTWIERYPDVSRSIGTDPLFEVGSHSYGDEAFQPGCFDLASLDLSRAADDLERNQTLLAGISPHPTPFFRFPGGCFDPAAVAAVRAAGVQPVQYDVVSGDSTTTDPEAIVSSTVSSVRPGSIVLLHVTGGDAAPATDLALPQVISRLRALGYQLVRLSDLLAAARQ